MTKLTHESKGTFEIAPTPFHVDGRIDEKSIDLLTDFYGEIGCNGITVLDTHDGIGVHDVGASPAGQPGLLPPAAIESLVEGIHARSHGESRRATGAAASNLDLYQVNCTYYDALGRDDTAYLIARAIQFFVPGVPQVYYTGLLAGHNDMELLARTGHGRDINRHYYTPAEIESSLARPVVQALFGLIRFRNEHPAFAGEFELGPTDDHEVRLVWRNGAHWAALDANLATRTAVVSHSTDGGPNNFAVDAQSSAALQPAQRNTSVG